MSTEELLAKRYKVIAEYPGGIYKVGDFVQPHAYYGFDIFPYPEKYPHLFKPIQWWEDRDERPTYVKCVRTPDQNIMPGEVLKVKWNTVWGLDEKNRAIVVNTNCFIPATESEWVLFNESR